LPVAQTIYQFFMFKTAIHKLFTGNRKLNAQSRREVTVLYGGKSGNSEFVAKEIGRHFFEHGKRTVVLNMSKYHIERLSEEKLLLVVVSTHGEGEPPPAAAGFYRELMSGSMNLSHLEYAVCALGDSGYEFFCQTGKDIDKRLEELGASRLYQRVDCDVNFEKTAGDWISAVLKQRLSLKGAKEIKIEPSGHIQYHEAVIKQKYVINEGSSDPVFHLILEVDPGQVTYFPGDNIGILPPNPPELVREIIRFLNFNPDQLVTIEEEETMLADLLRFRFEVTTLSKDTVVKYQKLIGDELLYDLIKNEQELYTYCHHRDLLDLLYDFHGTFTPGDLISILHPFRLRYYSIASSQSVIPEEIHLTVKPVKFELASRIRQGACSTYLTGGMDPGDVIRFHLVPAKQFRLPKNNNIPLILIAAGTGIAPFRAFLQERALSGKNGQIWLIFGEKHEEYDFLYKKELEGWYEQKILTKLDLAFSRDHASKRYVQHIITEKGKEFLAWLEAGASIYVCGSVKMGKGVREAISCLFETPLQTPSAGSSQFVDQFIEQGRYFEDLY
jgi:sulfite reductase (NADPH) flavoprotein alpha-component